MIKDVDQTGEALISSVNPLACETSCYLRLEDAIKSFIKEIEDDPFYETTVFIKIDHPNINPSILSMYLDVYQWALVKLGWHDEIELKAILKTEMPTLDSSIEVYGIELSEK